MRQSSITVAALVLASALVAATALIFAARDPEGSAPVVSTTVGPSSTPSTEPPTSVVPSTGTETTAPSTTPSASTTPSSITATSTPVDTTTAVYPTTGTLFDDPVDLVRAFATEYVGFTEPIVGEFRSGDARSGEVDIRPSSSGPVTTALVRRLGDGWWVLGATTPAIDLQDPPALAAISSPVRLRGVSTAFEATVGASIRQDGDPDPLGRGVVMGGSMGEFGPFDGTISFSTAATPNGAIVLTTRSMADGTVWEATVVRVAFEGH